MDRLTSFRPVVAGAALAENEVVGTEKTAKRPRANSVHRARLEVNKHGTRHVLVGADLIVVDRDTLKLEVIGALVQAIVFDTVFIRDDLPELDTWWVKEEQGG
jgi:hypothetical protein